MLAEQTAAETQPDPLRDQSPDRPQGAGGANLELIAELVDMGVTGVTSRKLERWRQAGALPRVRTDSLGRAGTVTTWPPGTAQQVAALVGLLEEGVPLRRCPAVLFVLGFPVEPDKMRQSFLDLYEEIGASLDGVVPAAGRAVHEPHRSHGGGDPDPGGRFRLLAVAGLDGQQGPDAVAETLRSPHLRRVTEAIRDATREDWERARAACADTFEWMRAHPDDAAVLAPIWDADWPPQWQSRGVKALRVIQGDATEPQAKGPKVVAHVCNDLGGWGKGFVLAISRRWPEPERAFRQWHRGRAGNDFGLGATQLVQVRPDLWVANMVAQRGIRTGSNGPPIRYGAVERCLAEVGEHALRLGATVHMPRIGCGLAGGRWSRVEPLIVAGLCVRDVGVTVYDHE